MLREWQYISDENLIKNIKNTKVDLKDNNPEYVTAMLKRTLESLEEEKTERTKKKIIDTVFSIQSEKTVALDIDTILNVSINFSNKKENFSVKIKKNNDDSQKIEIHSNPIKDKQKSISFTIPNDEILDMYKKQLKDKLIDKEIKIHLYQTDDYYEEELPMYEASLTKKGEELSITGKYCDLVDVIDEISTDIDIENEKIYKSLLHEANNQTIVNPKIKG